MAAITSDGAQVAARTWSAEVMTPAEIRALRDQGYTEALVAMGWPANPYLESDITRARHFIDGIVEYFRNSYRCNNPSCEAMGWRHTYEEEID